MGAGVRKATHFDDLHGPPLFGDEQPTALIIVGQAFEAVVAAGVDAQGQLLGIGRVEECRVVIHMNLDQPLTVLVADHVNPGADVLDRLGVTKPGQGNSSENPPFQAQLDQLGVFVGHGKEGFALRIEAERRDISLQAVDGPRLNLDLIGIEAQRLSIAGLPEHVPVEPEPLDDPVFACHEKRRGQNQQDK